MVSLPGQIGCAKSPLRERLTSKEAIEPVGCGVDAIDLCVGGAHRDLSKDRASSALEAAIEVRSYSVVWLATPCSSFSVLHLDGRRARIRWRECPAGLSCLNDSDHQKACLSRHNCLVLVSAQLALVAARGGDV